MLTAKPMNNEVSILKIQRRKKLLTHAFGHFQIVRNFPNQRFYHLITSFINICVSFTMWLSTVLGTLNTLTHRIGRATL